MSFKNRKVIRLGTPGAIRVPAVRAAPRGRPEAFPALDRPGGRRVARDRARRHTRHRPNESLTTLQGEIDEPEGLGRLHWHVPNAISTPDTGRLLWKTHHIHLMMLSH
jgi:hypothetical protein